MNWKFWKRTLEIKEKRPQWCYEHKEFNIKTAKLQVNFISGKSQVFDVAGMALDGDVTTDFNSFYGIFEIRKIDAALIDVEKLAKSKDVLVKIPGINIKNVESWNIVENSVQDLMQSYYDYEWKVREDNV